MQGKVRTTRAAPVDSTATSWWRLRNLSRRRIPLIGTVLALLLLVIAVARNVDRPERDAVSYRVWSANSAITAAPAIVVANTFDEWREIWLKAGRTAPPFDPGRATGVGIFLGERTGDVPTVHVVGASQRGQRLVVTFEEIPFTAPRAASPARRSDAASAPWAIITLDKTGLPISVEERIRH